MSFKTTGILALFLALLGGYIYLFELRGWEEIEKAKEAERKVAQVGKGKVAKLRLDTPGNSVSAVREGFKWKILSPIRTDGDFGVFEGLIEASGTLEKAGVAADTSQTSLPNFSLADFGLESPAVRLTFTDGEGETQEVAFGDRSPTGAYFYVKVSEDDQIYLAESRFYYQFELSLLDLRDKRYVRFDPDRVREIEMILGDLRIAAERVDYSWRMTEPVSDIGDDVGINGFLTSLRDARIEKFSGLAVADDTGLDKPWFQVKLYEGDDRELRGVSFGDKAGVRAYRRYLAKSVTSPYVFEADSAFVHELIAAGDHFRTKDIFTFDRHSIDRLEMIFPDSNMIFIRRAREDWDLASHPDHYVVGTRLEDFLDEIFALRAQSYVAEEIGQERRLVFQKNGIRLRLMIGSELSREIVVGAVDEHLYAATNDRNQIVQIERYFLGKIRDVRIYRNASTPPG
ncbi:DUF4340 domain-containing protein [bacterium]|nr:DUF4340 domain-containing protein [bacterium]